MKKTLLLASVATLALSGGAYAQDADDDNMSPDASQSEAEHGTTTDAGANVDASDDSIEGPNDDGMMSEGDDMMSEDSMSSEDSMMPEEDSMSGDMSMESAITVEDVMIDGDTATFSSVTIPENGYLVIHATQDGEPVVPASIGHAAIMAGENTDVAVTIDYPFDESESYIAMLHSETNDNDTYDFGEGSTDVDTPVMMNEAPVTASFEGSGGM